MVCRVGVAVLLLAVKTKTVPLLVSAPYIYNGRGAPILHRTVRALFGKDSENRAGCEKNGANAFFFDKNIFFQKICLYLQSQTERFSVTGDIWRDAGVVDRAALEMRCTGNCTGGSNPSLSAKGGWTKAPKIPVSSSLTGIFAFAGWTDETPRGSLPGGKKVPSPFPCHRRRVLIR